MIFKKFYIKIIAILFSIIMGVLFFMSLSSHCQIDIYSYSRIIEKHTTWIYFSIAIIIVICLLFLLFFKNKFLTRINTKVAFCIFTSIIFLFCLAWVSFYDSVPTNDQATLYNEALKIVGYNTEPYNETYMIAFKRQRLVVLLIAFGIKLFGNNFIGFKLLNIMGALGIYLGIHKIVKNEGNDRNFSTLTMGFFLLFYPIVIYTSFLYGTLLSATFTIWAVYNAILWIKLNCIKNAIAIPILFTLALSMHQSSAIALIAVFLYLIININKKVVCKNIIIIILTLLMIFVFGKVIDLTYEKITNIEKGDSLPPLATIAMGLTSTQDDGGPGSQDGSFFTIYNENNRNSVETNKASIKIISNAFKEFVTGKRSLHFFVDKIKYQWLDPTFGAKKTITTNWEKPFNSEIFLYFYNNETIRGIFYKIANIFMIIIYGFSFFTGLIFTFNSSYIKNDTSNIHVLFQMYVIGGFIFQLFWESLSRYCFPYYLFIIIEGVFGIIYLYNKICRKYVKIFT